jgi:hypothetical protein
VSTKSQAEAFALYGLSPPPAAKKPKHGCVEVLSSQEVASSQEFDLKAKETIALEPGSSTHSPPVTHWVDPTKMVMVRVLPDGRKEETKLQASSSGFCVAKWEHGVEVQTELPNLLLQAKPIRKKPAAPDVVVDSDVDAGEEEKPEEDKPEDQQEDKPEDQREDKTEGQALPCPCTIAIEPCTYLKIYDKNGHASGIRRKFLDKRQVFQIGGNRCSLMKEQLAEVADKAIASLEKSEQTERMAKEWCSK